MRIAVISDTHNKLPARLLPLLGEADEIWHLGDVCAPAILDPIRAIRRPLRVIRGNCDANGEWPLSLNFELEGFQILLIHIPPATAPNGVDLLLHGHTHVPRDEQVGRTRFLNPGCITRPNRGAAASWAWLELTRGEEPRWRLEAP